MIILQSTEQSRSIFLIGICHLSSIQCFNNWDGLLNQSKCENKGCWQCRKHFNATQGKQQCRDTHRGRNSHLISCSLFSSTTVGGTLETTTCMSKALTTDTYKPTQNTKEMEDLIHVVSFICTGDAGQAARAKIIRPWYFSAWWWYIFSKLIKMIISSKHLLLLGRFIKTFATIFAV